MLGLPWGTFNTNSIPWQKGFKKQNNYALLLWDPFEELGFEATSLLTGSFCQGTSADNLQYTCTNPKNNIQFWQYFDPKCFLSRKFWNKIIFFGPNQTILLLINFDQFWSKLIRIDQNWSNLIKIEFLIVPPKKIKSTMKLIRIFFKKHCIWECCQCKLVSHWKPKPHCS